MPTELNEASLRSLLDQMLEGCQVIGPDWRYEYVNASAARHGRRKPEELLGHTIMGMYPGIEQTELFENMKRCMKERVSMRLENQFSYFDGTSSYFDLSILPFHSGLIVLSYDITDRKQLEKEVSEISNREQSRIGHDLHDGLCQHLAGIEFRLLALKTIMKGDPQTAAKEIDKLAALVREGIEQARTLAHGLSPVMLHPNGLMQAIEDLAKSIKMNWGRNCTFHCPTPIAIHDNAVATHLYRIAQEAVHNSIRHGKATEITIGLVRQSDRIVLGIKDNGIGLHKKDHAERSPGMGLRVMQYRAGLVNGTLMVQHENGGGTSVVCSLRVETAKP